MPLTVILFAVILSIFANVSVSSAQTQQWLYGINRTFDANQIETNSLVRINPVTFEQTVVGPIMIIGVSQPAPFRGIEFDPNLNRLLVADQHGMIFSINQDTAVGVLPVPQGFDQSAFVVPDWICSHLHFNPPM